MAFASQLKSWRLAKGMTQEALAQKAGVPRPNLADLESGRRDCTVKTLVRFAYALQISPGTLLDSGPPHLKTLDRHQIDAIARSLLEPKIKLPPSLERIRHALQPKVAPILRAVGIPLKARRSKLTKDSRRDQILAETDPDSLDHLISRVNKLAASLS